MGKLNRQDPSTAIPQLEAMIEELKSQLDNCVTSDTKRQIFVSDSEPTQADGKDGDIWIRRENV